MAKIVADLMSSNVITLHPETSLNEAIQVFVTHKITGVPVVDQSDKLVGILSETDLMWRETGVPTPAHIMFLDSVIYLENPLRYEKELHKALGQTVGEVMTHDVVTITPNRTIKEAAKIMYDKHVRRLPVIDQSKVVIGIITRSDIVRSMAESLNQDTLQTI